METTRGLRRAARATAENETSIGVTFSCDFIVKLSRDADLAAELLEALEAARPYLNGTCNDMAVVEGVDEAIAKARA